MTAYVTHTSCCNYMSNACYQQVGENHSLSDTRCNYMFNTCYQQAVDFTFFGLCYNYMSNTCY